MEAQETGVEPTVPNEQAAEPLDIDINLEIPAIPIGEALIADAEFMDKLADALMANQRFQKLLNERV